MSDEAKKKIAQELFGHGTDAVQKKNFGYAVECFGKCCRLLPDNLIFRKSLRDAERKNYKDNKKGAAMASVRIQPALAKLKIAKARKKWEEVANHAEEALTINPWDATSHYELANALLQMECVNSAVWVGEQCAELDKKNKAVHKLLGEIYEADGQFERASVCYSTVHKLDPKEHEYATKARQTMASATIDKGKYEEGEGFRGSLADAEQTDQMLQEQRGGQDARKAQTEREVEELQKSIEEDPTVLGNYLQLGDLYRKLDKFDEAVQTYKTGLDASGGGDTDLSIRYQESQIDPFRKRLEIMMDRLRNFDKSVPDAAKKFAKLKEQAQACNNEIAKRELELFRFKTQVDPDDAVAQYDYGELLFKFGKHDDAIKALQKARSEPSVKAKSLCVLGKAFWKKKNVQLAEKNLGDAIANVSANDEELRKDIWYTQGCIAQEQGDNDAATGYFNEIAAIDYGYRDVAKRLDDLT